MELKHFVAKAKKDTYASGKKAEKLPDGSERFIFEDGEWKYQDTYFAFDNDFAGAFFGTEIVWHAGKISWCMNYYGQVKSSEANTEKVYAFLRKAMSQLSADRPFRGPSRLKEEDFEYRDESEGDINQFRGTEIILYRGKEVYRLEYHGGIIQ